MSSPRVYVSAVFGIALTPEECLAHGFVPGMVHEYLECSIALGDSMSDETWYVYCIEGYLPIFQGYEIGGPAVNPVSGFPVVSPEANQAFLDFCLGHGLGDRTPGWLIVSSWS